MPSLTVHCKYSHCMPAAATLRRPLRLLTESPRCCCCCTRALPPPHRSQRGTRRTARSPVSSERRRCCRHPCHSHHHRRRPCPPLPTCTIAGALAARPVAVVAAPVMTATTRDFPTRGNPRPALRHHHRLPREKHHRPYSARSEARVTRSSARRRSSW